MIINKTPSNHKELIIYIWRSLDLQSIGREELIYYISFELFLLKPNKSVQLVNELIKKGFLVEKSGKVFLSKELRENFITWQKKKNEKVKNALEDISLKAINLNNLSKERKGSFNMFLKELSDESTLNRSVSVSKNSFTFHELNIDQGIIRGEVSGTKEKRYKFEVELNKKKIIHDCHDYLTRKSRQKKLCKHLVKLFIILKSENESKTEKILTNIMEELDDWEFI